MASLDKEKRVVVLLTKGNLDEFEKEELKELLSSHMNWSTVYGLLHSHRVFGMAYYHINDYFKHDVIKKFVYPKLYSSLKTQHRVQTLRNEGHIQHTLSVCKALNDNKIQYVLLKGIAMLTSIYPDIGCREFSDTDILVHPNQLQDALRVIKELGYVQGDFDIQKGEVLSANRRDIIIRPLVSHEVLPLQKKVPNNEFFSSHTIDLQFSIDLMTGNRTNNDVEKILSRRIEIPIEGQNVFTLSWEDTLLYLCIHFYKESTSDFEVNLYKDLALYKICDLNYLLSSTNINIDWDEFTERVIEMKMDKSVYYSFYYLSNVFPVSEEVKKVMDELKPVNLEYLDEVYEYNSDQLAVKWEDPVYDRFFNFNRAKHLKKNYV